MPKYLSGRVKRRDQAYLSTDRYQFLGLDQAEPNLGDSPSTDGSPNIPAGQQYQIVSLIERPGERFWVPIGGGIIPGSISIFDETSVVGTINSITQLNFTGNAITALATDLREVTLTLKNSESFSFTKSLVVSQTSSSASGVVKFATTNSGIVTLTNVVGSFDNTGVLKQDNVAIGQTPTGSGVIEVTTGVAATISVSPPGPNKSILYKDVIFDPQANSGVGTNRSDFATSPFFVFDDSVGIGSVGIGTSGPTENLHVVGNLRLESAIVDENNFVGNAGDLLVKTATGGLQYTDQKSVEVAAAGTFTQVQFHDSTGLLGGADNFVFDFTNNRIGIGSTQPDRLLDVLGDSRFVGFTTFTNDIFIGVGATVGFGSTAYFRDNAKAVFGNDEDLKIYHDGSNAYIDNTIGRLFIRDNGFGSINLQPTSGENSVVAKANDSVELYFNASKKIETTNEGILVSGGTTTGDLRVTGFGTFENRVAIGSHLDMPNDARIRLGLNDDLQIYHAGNGDSVIHESGSGNLLIRATNLSINDSTNNNTYFSATNEGSVDLFHNNNLRFRTTGIGVSVLGITSTTHLNVIGVSTFQDNIFVGTGATVGFGSTAYFRDNAKVVFGDDEDLKIYHTGNHSIIKNDTGNLILQDDNNIVLEKLDGTNLLVAAGDGVKLYFDSDEKIKTTNEGVLVSGGTTTGDFKATGVSTFNDNAIIDGTLTVGAPSIITGGAPTDQGNLAVYGTGKNSLIIQTTSNEDDRGIAFRNAGDAYVAYIAAVDRGFSEADLRFGISNRKDSIDDVSERMRITKEGNVGIGTTNPTEINALSGNTATLAVGILTANSLFSRDLNVSGVSTFTDDIFVGVGATVGFGSTAYFRDNAKAVFGNDEDLKIYHDGEDSIIEDSGTGSLELRTSTLKIKNPTDTKLFATANINGVKLYENNNIKFETTNEGILVSGGTTTGDFKATGVSTFAGNILPTTTDSINIGESESLRFDKIFAREIFAETNTILDNQEIGTLKVTGISTFIGLSTFANGIQVVSGTATFDGDIDANGGANIDGGLVANSAKISDLTEDRVVIVGSDGELEDSPNLTFDGSTLAVTGDGTFSGNVSIAGTLTYEDVTNVDAIGLITARNGIHVTGAGVSVAGISTFINDVEFRSKIGIGTTNPQQELHIQNNIPIIRFTKQNGTTDNKNWNIGAGTPQILRIQAIRDNGSGGGQLFDFYRNDGDVEELRARSGTDYWFTINNDTKKVGIGSTVPQYELDVFKAYNGLGVGNTAARIYGIDSGVAETGISFVEKGSNLHSSSTSYLMRGISDGETKFVFGANGNVGIGTDIPDQKLHVYNGAGNVTSFVEAIEGDAILDISNSGNGNFSGINFTRERKTVGGVRQTGRVGGSIFMPSNTSNNEAFLYIQTQSANANAGETDPLDPNNGVRLKLHGDDGIFSIETGDSERLRIDNNGNVGIGSTIPTAKLDVLGDSRFVGFTTFTNDIFVGVGATVGFGTTAYFRDNAKVVFGDDEGLRITRTDTLANQNNSQGQPITIDDYVSIIEDRGDGPLIFKSNGGGGPGAFQFFDNNWRPLLKLIQGSTQRTAILYHLGEERLETNGQGILVSGGTTTRDFRATGVSTFQDDIFVGVGATVGFGTTAYFNDNAKAVFGDDENLSIYYDGSQSYIEEFGSGQLYIRGSAAIHLENSGGTKKYFRGVNGGSAELFFDGDEKIKTTNEGVLVSGGTTTRDFKATGVSTFVSNAEFKSSVGIGTTNPLVKLDVRGSLGISAVTDTSLRTTISSSSAGLIINHGDNSPTIFQNAGIERVRFEDTGEVGIGTNDPTGTNALTNNNTTLAVGIITTNSLFSRDLKVSGVSTFQDDIFVGVGATVGFGSTAYFRDNAKAVFGDNDNLLIEHLANGDSRIIEAGSGNLYIGVGGEISNSTFNITVTAPTASYYTLSGTDRNGSVSGNDVGVTVNVGDTINFNLSGVSVAHPFYIRVANQGANVSTPAATGQGSTGTATVSWTPNTTGTYYYQCGNHPGMIGTITVQSNSASGGRNLNITEGFSANYLAQFKTNNSVDLYFNRNLKFETTNEGVLVSGGTTTGDFRATGVSTHVGFSTFKDGIFVTGVSTFTGNILPDSNESQNIGANGNRWNTLFVNEVNASGGSIVVDNYETNILKVNGISTFIGVSTFADGIQVVSGIATFDGNIDANQNLDVDGTTTLDDTTIDGLLDINAGGQANTFKVEDLTEDRVVIVGSDGELEDSANLTFNGSTLTVTGAIDADGDLDVDGHTELDDLNVSGFSTFVSNAEFKGNVSIAGTLTYEDVTNVDAIGLITARNGIHVTGAGVSVAGISTFIDTVEFRNKVGINTADPQVHDLHVNGNAFVDADLILRDRSDSEVKLNGQSGSLEIYADGVVKLIESDNDKEMITFDINTTHNDGRIYFEGDKDTFLNHPGDNQLGLAAGGYEIMKITSDTVGIGSTVPNMKVGIGSAILGASLEVLEQSDNTYGNGVARFKYFETDENILRLDVLFKTAGSYHKTFATGAGTDFLIVDADNAAGRHSFAVEGDAGNNKSFTVDSTGLVGIGTDSPNYNLHIIGTAAATNFDSLSDRKVKTNIKIIQDPIDKIKKIDGVSFNWKSDNKPSLGVIADNVEEVLPEIVSSNDPKSVNYNGLIGLLIEVVKDQQKQIDELRGLLDK